MSLVVRLRNDRREPGVPFGINCSVTGVCRFVCACVSIVGRKRNDRPEPGMVSCLS